MGVADKIHALDSKALVTTGSWNSLASTNVVGDDPVYKKGFNHYSDTCLYKAGGREKGVMDFAQFHSYPWAGRWGSDRLKSSRRGRGMSYLTGPRLRSWWSICTVTGLPEDSPGVLYQMTGQAILTWRKMF